MVYISLKTNPQRNSFLLSTSNYAYNHSTTTNNDYSSPRKLSIVGSDSYKRSLRRAFSRAKSIAFFNPDLTHFVTLTYKKNHQNPKQTIQDIKNLIKYQSRIRKTSALALGSDGCPGLNSPSRGMKPRHQNEHREPQSLPKNKNNLVHFQGDKSKEEKAFKYIYVMELQKRGAIHVHMICNDWLETEWVGSHLNVKGWSHGFSDVLTIKNFDNNFKPYLYLFKYMSKAQRVGKSFIHVSRNFDKIEDVEYDEYVDKLIEENLFYQEDYKFIIEEKECNISKQYYRKTA